MKGIRPSIKSRGTVNQGTIYSKTPIYCAPIYRAPQLTEPKFYPPKTSFVCKSVLNDKCTPIYRASRLTGLNSFPPKGPVNWGFTVHQNTHWDHFLACAVFLAQVLGWLAQWPDHFLLEFGPWEHVHLTVNIGAVTGQLGSILVILFAHRSTCCYNIFWKRIQGR